MILIEFVAEYHRGYYQITLLFGSDRLYFLYTNNNLRQNSTNLTDCKVHSSRLKDCVIDMFYICTWTRVLLEWSMLYGSEKSFRINQNRLYWFIYWCLTPNLAIFQWIKIGVIGTDRLIYTISLFTTYYFGRIYKGLKLKSKSSISIYFWTSKVT